MVNKHILIGRIGNDPEFVPVGNHKVLKFSLATNSFYNGENQTEWHNIVAWGKSAETIHANVKKGSQIYIEGQSKTNRWEKDGQRFERVEVTANIFRFLDSKPSDSPGFN